MGICWCTRTLVTHPLTALGSHLGTNRHSRVHGAMGGECAAVHPQARRWALPTASPAMRPFDSCGAVAFPTQCKLWPVVTLIRSVCLPLALVSRGQGVLTRGGRVVVCATCTGWYRGSGSAHTVWAACAATLDGAHGARSITGCTHARGENPARCVHKHGLY